MKKIILLFFSLIIAGSLSACNSKNINSQTSNILIDVPAIAGKTKENIDLTLKEKGIYDKDNKITKYKNGLLDIYFYENKAERLTINVGNFKKYDYLSCKNYNSLLNKFNLTPEDPSFSNEFVTRWAYINDIYEVSCAPAGNKIFYIYVNVSNANI